MVQSEKTGECDLRPVYTAPCVVRICDLKQGAGDCVFGSGDSGDCNTGNIAGAYCCSGNNGTPY